jgi:hypothetical protein
MTKRLLLPDDEKLLARYFSGALEAEMGVRSTLGSQIESLKRGFVIYSDGFEMDERCLDAARDSRRVGEVLHRLKHKSQKVLQLWYTPQLTRELCGPMKTFGPYGRLVVWQWKEPLVKLVKICEIASRKKKNSDVRAAKDKVYKLQHEAEKQVLAARREYSEVLKQWRILQKTIKERKRRTGQL